VAGTVTAGMAKAMVAYTDGFMASVTCGLTAEDRDQLLNPRAGIEHGTAFTIATPELSMGWVDPRVGLGLVENGSKICVFNGLGWVMGLK